MVGTDELAVGDTDKSCDDDDGGGDHDDQPNLTLPLPLELASVRSRRILGLSGNSSMMSPAAE